MIACDLARNHPERANAAVDAPSISKASSRTKETKAKPKQAPKTAKSTAGIMIAGTFPGCVYVYRRLENDCSILVRQLEIFGVEQNMTAIDPFPSTFYAAN
jgi:hypothetical protein